jgi:hypothetical protein
MSESKSPLASAVPMMLVAAVVGGALWYCGEAQVFPHAKAAAAAFGFALLGGLVAVLARGQASVSQEAKASGDAQTAVAKAIAEAIEKSQAGVVGELGKLQKEIAAVGAQLNSANAASQKGLGDFVGKVSNLGADWSGQVLGAFKAHRDMLQTALEELQKHGEGWRARFEAAVNGHAGSIEKSNRSLAETLEKIALVGRDIDKLLQVQKTIDTSLENMSRTEDFKRTIGRLAEHLESVERTLKETAKPRSIRLVETHAD